MKIKLHVKKFLPVYLVLFVIFDLVAAAFLAELYLRLTEKPKVTEGGIGYAPDPVIGWRATVGRSKQKTEEFDIEMAINDDHMNGRSPDPSDANYTRVMALGDSHTFASAVSTVDAWPNVLDKSLESKKVRVFNLGTAGYSVHQYYFRMFQDWHKVKPNVVVVAISMATDLHDILTPRFGGWVYGEGLKRSYFDFDDMGTLIQKTDPTGRAVAQTVTGAPPQNKETFKLRGYLENFALYRHFKRSLPAFWLSMVLRPNGKSLWPGMDTILSKKLDFEQRYAWALFESILGEINKEAGSKGAKVLFVTVPYLAQVYDDVWKSSFGLFPDKYGRDLPQVRMAKLCERQKLNCLDLTEKFVQTAREKKHWLHFKQDGHPTAEGQRLIASEIEAKLQF